MVSALFYGMIYVIYDIIEKHDQENTVYAMEQGII